MSNELIGNINRLRTTEMGVERIKRISDWQMTMLWSGVGRR